MTGKENGRQRRHSTKQLREIIQVFKDLGVQKFSYDGIDVEFSPFGAPSQPSNIDDHYENLDQAQSLLDDMSKEADEIKYWSS